MKISNKIIVVLAALTCIPVYACTGVTVKTNDGTVISTRSMEFAGQLKSKGIFIPRGFNTQVKFDGGKSGAKWQQKYAVLGINALDYDLIVEGFNEKGLNVGAFYLPGFAVYEKLSDANASKAITSVQFPSWATANFATVDEVKNALKDIVVVDAPIDGQKINFPLHYRVTDASGNQIIVEYVKSGLKVYDNPIGVVTNSPEFDWHLINLRNYINLSPTNVPTETISGVKLKDLGQGEGMHGLPGDYTPPSRFVRTVAIHASALPVDTADEGVNLSWHIINNTDIPIGTTRDVGPGGEPYLNYTQWTNVSDLKNLKLYFKTYNNQDVRVIDMKKLKLDAKEVKIFEMDTKANFKDISVQQ